MITIVNVRNAIPSTYEYCGRRNTRYGLLQSPLANPYPLKRESERQLVLTRYRVWFYGMAYSVNPAFDTEIGRLVDLADEGDLALGCWCAPKRCHCEVIKEYLELIQSEEKRLERSMNQE